MTNYGPKTEWNALQVGTRVYYTGDMANHCGFGTITARHEIDPRWGYRQVDIQLDDDGHLWRRIGIESFQPSPGRRFWLSDDWMADRERRIVEMKVSWDAASARRRVGGTFGT